MILSAIIFVNDKDQFLFRSSLANFLARNVKLNFFVKTWFVYCLLNSDVLLTSTAGGTGSCLLKPIFLNTPFLC